MLWGTPSGSALELSTVGHTVGHRGPLTVRFLLGKWRKRLLRVECWFRRGAPIPSPAPVSGPKGPWAGVQVTVSTDHGSLTLAFTLLTEQWSLNFQLQTASIISARH